MVPLPQVHGKIGKIKCSTKFSVCIPLKLMIFWFLQMLGKNYVLKINSTNLCCTKPLNLGCFFLHGTQHFSTIFLQKKITHSYIFLPLKPKVKISDWPTCKFDTRLIMKKRNRGHFYGVIQSPPKLGGYH